MDEKSMHIYPNLKETTKAFLNFIMNKQKHYCTCVRTLFCIYPYIEMSLRHRLFRNPVLDSLSSCRTHIRPTSNQFEVLHKEHVESVY